MKNIMLLLCCVYLNVHVWSQSLSPAATFIFKNIKTPISNADKNMMAKDLVMSVDKKSVEIKDMEGSYTGVSVFPTDLNKDGIDEIFLLTSNSFYFGNVGSNCVLYIKDASGKYVLQPDVSGPILAVRSTYNLGYPDLIYRDYMPVLWQEPVKVASSYRWNGKKYAYYKDGPYKKDDKNVDEVSELYVKSGGTKKADTEKAITGVDHFKVPESTVALSAAANILFTNVKTSLSIEEKNAVAELTGFTAADTLEKTKKGKPKKSAVILPVDLNGDGVEEIFVCAKTLTLGITINNYFFYAKDASGIYKPLPGKIGVITRIIDANKQGYPDLITGTAGLPREIWSWNGRTYYLAQKVNGNVNYKTKDIEDVSNTYVQKL